jgi:hypothetical protein
MNRGLQLVVLVIAGVALAMLVGAYVENRDSALMPSGRWLGWMGSTVLLFTFAVRDHRPHWGRLSFGLMLGGLFAVHTLLFAAIFRSVSVWRGIWFLPISIVEYFGSLAALDWLDYSADERTTDRKL